VPYGISRFSLTTCHDRSQRPPVLDCDLALSLLERTASASRSCCLDMQLFPMLPGLVLPSGCG
jgi:hypothetical protein